MLTLLSPAKKLNLDPVDTGVEPTQPELHTQAQILARIGKTKTADDLKKMMKLSDNLAELNADRFQAFRLNGNSNIAKPALLTFDGDVYWGFDAKTLAAKDMEYAQTHLRIISGLYGVLRPMDKIQPYRLEMGTKFANERGKNLYEFWGDRIATSLKQDLEGHKDNSIINLASNEYFKAVDTKTLGAPVLNFSFLNIKDGKARSLMYYAKRARGSLARWVMENRIENADDLKGFDTEGYAFDKKASTDTKLVFTRKQPPTLKK